MERGKKSRCNLLYTRGEKQNKQKSLDCYRLRKKCRIMTHFSTFSFYTNNCNVIWILDFLECAGSLSCYEPSRSRQYFVPRSSSKIYLSYQTNQKPQVLYNATTHFSPRTEESCTTKIVAKTLHPSGVNLYKWTIRHLAADLPDDAAVFVSRVHFDLHAVETRGVIVLQIYIGIRKSDIY